MEKIRFKDLDWYVLEKDNENIKLLLVDVLDEEHIKKYVDDEWYRDGYEVRHSSDKRCGKTWEDSYIKQVILENFKKDLGIDCEVTLLAKEEVNNLDDEVRRCNDWYWTKTGIEDATSLYFAGVSYNGHSNTYFASYYLGVRPILSMKISNLALDNINNKTPEKIELYKDNDGNYFIDKHCNKIYITCDEINFMVEEFNEIINYLKRRINNEK